MRRGDGRRHFLFGCKHLEEYRTHLSDFGEFFLDGGFVVVGQILLKEGIGTPQDKALFVCREEGQNSILQL